MTRGGYYVLETTVYIALLLVDNYSKIMHYYGRVRCVVVVWWMLFVVDALLLGNMCHMPVKVREPTP